MVSSTLCPAVHILGFQNVSGRVEGIADHYWPWVVFFFGLLPKPLVGGGRGERTDGRTGRQTDRETSYVTSPRLILLSYESLKSEISK